LFKQLFDPASSTYTYLLADDTTHEAVIIDPVVDQVERDMRLLREHGLKLVHTLETHVHADHITGAKALKQATGASTAVARECNAPGYDRLLKDRDVILFGRQQIVVIGTPGHTPGSVCYFWEDRVFTGDTLLIGGCGRTDFQNGSAEAMWTSVTEKLFRLDDQVLVYPGHDYKGRRVSTIGEERAFNARFTGQTRESFLAIMANLNLAMPRRIHEAVPANLVGGAAPSGPTAFHPKEDTAVQNVSPQQLAELSRDGAVPLIDVRTPLEFDAVRVATAINVPLDQLDPQALKARFAADRPIYVICQTGMRSQMAAKMLREGGFSQVVHVDGGTNAWALAGLPTERGRSTVSPQ
jgi:sulfur dioxygenase